MHAAEEVRVELGGDVLHRHVFHRSDVGEPGVVDDDVQPSEPPNAAVDGRFRAREVRDVERHRKDLLAIPRDEIGELRRLACCRHQLVARLQDGRRDAAAEAARAAGEEEGLCHEGLLVGTLSTG
jgi:hypothetical protein